MDEQSAPATSQSGNMDQTKIFAILGYLIPILFFIPLVTESKNDPFAKFHANQQLILLIFWVGGNLIAGVLTFAVIGLLLYPLVLIAGLVFMVLGIMEAVKGGMKPLPVIGAIKLLK